MNREFSAPRPDEKWCTDVTEFKYGTGGGGGGLTHSIFRVGRSLDNAPIESFRGTLKVEMYYLCEFQAYNQLTSAIEKYISFYNHERFQKRLNGLSPVEYKAQAA